MYQMYSIRESGGVEETAPPSRSEPRYFVNTFYQLIKITNWPIYRHFWNPLNVKTMYSNVLCLLPEKLGGNRSTNLKSHSFKEKLTRIQYENILRTVKLQNQLFKVCCNSLWKGIIIFLYNLPSLLGKIYLK